MIKATVDPQVVAEVGVNGANQEDHPTPRGSRDQAQAMDSALLHEIHQRVALS